MKSILYYNALEQNDFSFQGLVVRRGKDIPDINTRGNRPEFGAKQHTGGQLRPICGLAKNGRDTEFKEH